MDIVTVKTPWKEALGDIPMHLVFFEGSMVEKVCLTAMKYPDNIAFDYMGKSTTYQQMIREIERCAKALKTIGICENDTVTIALLNCPQAIFMFYAVNLIGAVANMVHPLAAEKEIEFYLNESGSVAAITHDQFYPKFESIRANTKLTSIIVTSMEDTVNWKRRIGYLLTEGRKIKKVPKDAPVIRWRSFIDLSNDYNDQFKVSRKSTDPAAILYSGGTTGRSKGVVLTNGNFNALAQQILATRPKNSEFDSVLSFMPLFHGFGLGAGLHNELSQGGRCVLLPRFNVRSFAKLLIKYRCNVISAVPTLFVALMSLPGLKKADLSFLKVVGSGGDTLPEEIEEKINRFLKEHNADVQVKVGYGLTETVHCCCTFSYNCYKKGSVGIPLPGNYIKIVEPGTERELPYGEEGEIVVAGPTVMAGYLNNPDETSQTLQRHADGLTWVYTGDLGVMDSEGFLFFRGRIKRMIISSGYSIYPGQLEKILDAHEKIQMSCIIGVPDSYRMQRVKAFVTLVPGVPKTEETRDELMAYCRKHIAKYAMPYEIEFRDELPKTLVGKIAYRTLEEEELTKTTSESSSL